MENKKKRIVVQSIEEKKGKTFADYADAFDYLISAGIALNVQAISNPKFPLIESSGKNLLKLYLNDDLRCSGLMQAKRSEMVYLLNCYYPIKELAAFYAPIYRYSHSFQYFVMQNYQKAKDVETFAQLGGYSVPTFRRIFKDTFGEPAYQWMLKRKCQDIHNDLIMTELSISEICYKYGFESLSNFSHFCRANFGQSPRSVRSLKDENT